MDHVVESDRVPGRSRAPVAVVEVVNVAVVENEAEAVNDHVIENEDHVQRKRLNDLEN